MQLCNRAVLKSRLPLLSLLLLSALHNTTTHSLTRCYLPLLLLLVTSRCHPSGTASTASGDSTEFSAPSPTSSSHTNTRISCFTSHNDILPLVWPSPAPAAAVPASRAFCKEQCRSHSLWNGWRHVSSGSSSRRSLSILLLYSRLFTAISATTSILSSLDSPLLSPPSSSFDTIVRSSSPLCSSCCLVS